MDSGNVEYAAMKIRARPLSAVAGGYFSTPVDEGPASRCLRTNIALRRSDPMAHMLIAAALILPYSVIEDVERSGYISLSSLCCPPVSWI